MADQGTELRELVAEVAAAYFSNSHVAASDIGGVIANIATALAAVGAEPVSSSAAEPEPVAAKLTPAQVRRSITPEALISFEDGRSYKTLRRHLATRGLTPEQYREKWGLPVDYPLVSAAYSAARSQMAKAIGLGRKAPARGRGGRARKA